MYQTLRTIPHEFLDWPVFGVGWALLIWAIFGVVLLLVLTRIQGWNADTRSYIPLLLIVAAAIVFVLPRLEQRDASGTVGLPIRGYGTMVLLGVICGVALALREARRMALDPEIVLSLAFRMFLWGILGARVFYILQFWPQFHKTTLGATLWAMVNVTEGGLVVYGSVMGAAAAAVVYLYRRRLPMLAIGDLIVPSLMLGLALGRIGCLLNGCCYGGECEIPALAVRFPPDSPPYLHQLGLGQLHAIRLEEQDGVVVVRSVAERSVAERAGVRAGDIVQEINGHPVASLVDAQRLLTESPGPEIKLTLADGSQRQWSIGTLPMRSLPVHPTQVYSAINAALLCLLFWSLYPFRRRDGQVFALMLTLYPITRFLLECIRNDEPGRLGTPLTISQWISLVLLVLVAGLWWYVQRGRPGSALAAGTEGIGHDAP